MSELFEIGDKVVKNPETWIPNEFDDWGRGLDVGIVVEPDFPLNDNEVDVKWADGTCVEYVEQLMRYDG